MYDIRRIRSGEADLFRDVRLRALLDAPEAFMSTYKSALERSWESWVEQSEGSVNGNERCTLMAFSQSKVVGIAAIYRLNGEISRSAEIMQMWVDPEHRDQGLGSEIVQQLLDWAGMERYTQIIATIHIENAVVVKFYEKLGFELDQAATDNAPPRDLILRLKLR